MNAKIKEFSNELEVDQNKYKYFPNKLKFYSEEEKKNIIPYLRKKRLLSMLNKVKIHKQGVETPKKNIEIQPIEIENIVEISNKSSEKISEKLKSLKISESPDYTEKNSAIFINESISHKAFSSPLKSKSSSRNLFESFLTPNNNKIIKNLNFKISKIKENEKPINKNPQKKIKFNKETNLFNILLERKANIFNQLNKSPIKKDPEKKNIEIVKNSKIKNNLSKNEIEGITKKKLVLLQLQSEIEAISLENSLSDISIEKERKNKKITKAKFKELKDLLIEIGIKKHFKGKLKIISKNFIETNCLETNVKTNQLKKKIDVRRLILNEGLGCDKIIYEKARKWLELQINSIKAKEWMRLRENTGDICENSIKTIGDLILSSKNIKLKNASKIDILNIFKKPNQLKNILNCIEKEISEDSFTNFLKNTDDIMNFIKDNLEDIELTLIRIIFTTSFMLKILQKNLLLKLKILPKLELNRSKTERILQKHIKNRPKSVKPTNYLEIWNQNIDFFEKNNLNIKKEITNKKTSFHAKNRRDKIEVKKNLQRQKSFEFQKNFFEENIFKNFQNEILGKEKLDLIIQNKEKIEFLKEIKKLEKENEKKYFEDQRENYMKIKFNVEKEKEQKLKTEKKILLVEKKNDLFNLKENKVKIKKILNQKENEEKDWKKLKEIINKFEKIENDKHNLEEITKSYEY